MQKFILFFLILSFQIASAQYTSESKLQLTFKFDHTYGKLEYYFLSGPGRNFENCTYQYPYVAGDKYELTLIEGDFNYVGGNEGTIMMAVSLISDNKIISKEVKRTNFFIQIIGLFPKRINSENIIQYYFIDTNLNPKEPFIRHEYKDGKIITKYFPNYVVSNNDKFSTDLIHGITNWVKVEHKN